VVTIAAIEQVFKKNGTTFTSLSMPEIRELQHILTPVENIKFCISGRYEGGFAVICATDLRLLLVDKKFMYLTIEDIRYDMIVEVDYNYRLMDATLSVVTPSRTLRFVSTKKQPLRNTATYVQHRVMELRHHQTHLGEQEQPRPITAQVMTANAQLSPDQTGATDEFADPLVSIQQEPTKQFVPRLPLRRVMNPYTQAPLASRRRVSRFYPSS
jgi:hypothetical protein